MLTGTEISELVNKNKHYMRKIHFLGDLSQMMLNVLLFFGVEEQTNHDKRTPMPSPNSLQLLKSWVLSFVYFPPFSVSLTPLFPFSLEFLGQVPILALFFQHYFSTIKFLTMRFYSQGRPFISIEYGNLFQSSTVRGFWNSSHLKKSQESK